MDTSSLTWGNRVVGGARNGRRCNVAKLAVLGGEPVRSTPWPKWPVADGTEEQALLEVLRSGNWWHGRKVREFGEAFARFQDAAYGITCCNGTVAIEAALVAAGVGAGDEVITTPYTFVATTSAILRVNAVPIFADIDKETGNLDPDDVATRITPRTGAIVPVHVAGLPVDIDRFDAMGREQGVSIVYDAAHGWGSQWRGKGVGAYGSFNTYSFQVSKNITAGEGGIVLTCDEALADSARSYANCGRSAQGAWYEHFLLGSNLRMTEFQAAILLAQLERLEGQTVHRERNVALLDAALADVPGLRGVPRDSRVTRRAHHMFQLRYDKAEWDGLPREKFVEALKAEGIPASRVWPLLYKMPLFTEYTKSGPKACPVSCPFYKAEPPDYAALNLPAAEHLSTETGIWIPHYCLLAEPSEMSDIVNAVAKIRENVGALLARP